MVKFTQDLKQVASSPKETMLFLKVLQGLMELGGSEVVEGMANLVDHMIATRINPFRSVDSSCTSEVLTAMAGFLDLMSSNGKHPVPPRVSARMSNGRISTQQMPPRLEPDGLEDGDTIRPQRDTRVNRVRRWILTLPAGIEITGTQIADKFGLDWVEVGAITSQMRKAPKVFRYKRDSNGNFKRGCFVKTAGADKICRDYLSGKNPGRRGKGTGKRRKNRAAARATS